MAITLSSTDYDELWQAANSYQEGIDREDLVEMREIVPPRLGQGCMQQIHLRGIDLCLFDYQLHQDLCLVSELNDEIWTSYEVGFNLSGNRSGKRTGENFLEWGTRPFEPPLRQLAYANDPVLKVDLHIDPDHEIGQLLAKGIANLSPPCQYAGSTSWLSDINVITPAMRLVLEQLWRCPFQGQTRRIFLESKCLELIALKLEQLSTELPQTRDSRPLSADDRDRIHAAQKILIDHLDNPPTLLDLARQVNLNDYKLKVGFKQVFGTTVFGYLHQHRMETARQLLHSRRLNVKEVAQAVGYANQSRFAAAFRKQFGVNPKAYGRGEGG